MKNNKKNYTILLIFALASLFLILFFIWTLLKEIENNSKDLTLAKANIVSLVAQTNEIQNFKKNYKIYEPDLEKIDQLFIDSDNLVDFIKFLEDTSSVSKITSQISLPPSSQISQQSQKIASQDFIIFQLASKGGFSEVLNFVEKIETGPYLIEIENLTIQNLQESATESPNMIANYSSRKIDAKFTIKVFIKPH